MVNIPFLGALAGCSARRSERRVASHTSEEQRRNAPGSAAKNGILAFSASLRLQSQELTRPTLPSKKTRQPPRCAGHKKSVGRRHPRLRKTHHFAQHGASRFKHWPGQRGTRALAQAQAHVEFSDSEGAKALGFSQGHFDFVVQALDDATGELLFRPEVVEDQLAVAAQGLGHLLHRLNA